MSSGSCRRHTYVLTPTLIVLAAAITAGCGDKYATVTIDENGVEIVENHRPRWGDESRWTIDPAPLLTIESWSIRHGTDSFHLSDVRRLPGGGFAVANGHMNELGYFDRQGRLIRMVGGEGTEPGQFSQLRAIHLLDGDVWAFDGMGRWNVFDTNGELLSTMYFEPTGYGWSDVEPFGDQMAALGSGGYKPPQAESGYLRDLVPILRYERRGAAIGTLAMIPGRQQYIEVMDGGQAHLAPPLALNATLHGGHQNLYAGSADRMEISVYGTGAPPVRVIRIPDFDLTLTDEEWVRVIRRWDDSFRRLRDSGPFSVPSIKESSPGTKPAYSQFLEDAEENLWVLEYGPVVRRRSSPPTRWTVFDPQGRWLGPVQTPDGLHVTEIGEDYVLGLVHANGKSVARLYRLER